MDPMDFKNAKTTVFWDVEDFPNPNNGESIDERIKSALKEEGYEGEVFIKAYGEKKPENLNVVDDGGGVIDFTTKSGKKERLARMCIDICLWSFDFPDSLSVRANLLVIAKTAKGGDRKICRALDCLQFTHNVNVLLVVDTDGTAEETILIPQNHWCSYWDWDDLLAGQKALRGEKIDGLLDEWHEELCRLLCPSLRVNEENEENEDRPPLLSANDDTAPCVYCEQTRTADLMC